MPRSFESGVLSPIVVYELNNNQRKVVVWFESTSLVYEFYFRETDGVLEDFTLSTSQHINDPTLDFAYEADLNEPYDPSQFVVVIRQLPTYVGVLVDFDTLNRGWAIYFNKTTCRMDRLQRTFLYVDPLVMVQEQNQYQNQDQHFICYIGQCSNPNMVYLNVAYPNLHIYTLMLFDLSHGTMVRFMQTSTSMAANYYSPNADAINPDQVVVFYEKNRVFVQFPSLNCEQEWFFDKNTGMIKWLFC
jgi:hypothetical protein